VLFIINTVPHQAATIQYSRFKSRRRRKRWMSWGIESFDRANLSVKMIVFDDEKEASSCW
jgi:hypothetical protein